MRKSQKTKVLEILKTHGEISRNWAIDARLTIRLAAIIHTLKQKEGYNITLREEGSDVFYTLHEISPAEIEEPKTLNDILRQDRLKKAEAAKVVSPQESMFN